MFDPNKFMQSNFNGKLDTVIPTLPEDDYRVIVDGVEHRTATVDGETRHILRVRWKLVDANQLIAIDRKAASVNHDLWLDLTPDGGLDEGEGKNIGLGQMLEALGLNGQPWSPGSLVGQGPVIARIAPRENKKKPGEYFNDVRRLVRLS